MIRAIAFYCLILSSNLTAAEEFPDKRLPVDENIWTSNEFVNATRGRDIVIRRLPAANSPCNNPDKCPPAVVIDVEKGNMNVKGKVNADAIYIGGQPIINQKGEWQGSTENLKGPQGVQGPKGDRGVSCTITQDSIICGDSIVALSTLLGPKGDRGPQGIQGPQGIRGPEGMQGPQGDVGPIGPQGLQGAKGEKGESCKIENGFIDCGGFKKSLDELKGPRGFQGEKGDRGEGGGKGEKGDPGTKGEKGDPGAKGDAGATGAPGANGLTGLKGDKGDTGSKGDAGAVGQQGPEGPKGEKGDQGSAGAVGPAGPAGFVQCETIIKEALPDPNGGQIAQSLFVFADCNTTSKPRLLVGGGCFATSNVLRMNEPTINNSINPSTGRPIFNRWQCRGDSINNRDGKLQASAICCGQ